MIIYIHINQDQIIDGWSIIQSKEVEKEEPLSSEFIKINADDPILLSINYGWRLGDDNNWYPPEPPTEEEIIDKDILDIKNQMTLLLDYEQRLQLLGIDPNSQEAEILLPKPTFVSYETPPEEDPCLYVSFSKLTGTWNESKNQKLKDIPSFQNHRERKRQYIERTKSRQIRPKQELLNELSALIERRNKLHH